MTRKELFRISEQYADLMYQKEHSNLLGKQNRERGAKKLWMKK